MEKLLEGGGVEWYNGYILFFKKMVLTMGSTLDLAEMKAEIIKWMFIFWIGQFTSIVGVLTAILFAFFKK